MLNKNVKVKEYKSNFIENAIFRVDFPRILDLNPNNPPAKIQNKLKKKYSIVNIKQGGAIDFKIEDGKELITQMNEVISWEFSDTENPETMNKITINPEFIAIEYQTYTTFKEFYEDIKLVFESFKDTYPLEIANRLGLRIINVIKWDEGHPLKWDNIIHPSLFSIPKNFVSENEDILRSMHVLEVDEDDYLLRFQFGIYNNEYPNPIARKEFVLDYDCFLEERMDINEIFKRSEDCNKIIDRWFERSIKEELRKEMGVKE